MTRLVIHIGDCKSGSTAIQSVLQAGTYDTQTPLLYPEAGRRGVLNHHRLSNSLFMAQAKTWQARAWGALAREISESDALAVVSSERFEFADPNVLRDVLHQHFDPLPDVHIIAYVRPHLDRVVSGYAQNIKQGIFAGSMTEFIAKMAAEQRFDFAPRLLRWMSVFEDMRVDIRPMIRDHLAGGCVVQDFLGLVSAAPAEVHAIPQANSAPSAPALAVLRQLWRSVGAAPEAQSSPEATALAQIARMLEAKDPFGGPKLRLTRAEAELAQSRFAEDARACDVQVFGRPVMGPAMTAACSNAPEIQAPHSISADAMAMAELWLESSAELLRARASAQSQGGQSQGGQSRRGRAATSAQWRGLRDPQG